MSFEQNKSEFQNIVRTIIEKLVSNEFDLLYELDYTKELSAEIIRNEISAYPGVLCMLSDYALDNLDIYDTLFANQHVVDVPLWFDGVESDLTLTCRIYEIEGDFLFSIEDLHVL